MSSSFAASIDRFEKVYGAMDPEYKFAYLCKRTIFPNSGPYEPLFLDRKSRQVLDYVIKCINELDYTMQDPFKYLGDQTLGSHLPPSQGTILQVRANLIKTHNKCKLLSPSKLMIPFRVAEKDKIHDIFIAGNINVSAHYFIVILHETKPQIINDGMLVDAMYTWASDFYSHSFYTLCKEQYCCEAEHLYHAPTRELIDIKLSQSLCASYYLINGICVNQCVCKTQKKCLVPGRQHWSLEFREIFNNVFGAAKLKDNSSVFTGSHTNKPPVASSSQKTRTAADVVFDNEGFPTFNPKDYDPNNNNSKSSSLSSLFPSSDEFYSSDDSYDSTSDYNPYSSDDDQPSSSDDNPSNDDEPSNDESDDDDKVSLTSLPALLNIVAAVVLFLTMWALTVPVFPPPPSPSPPPSPERSPKHKRKREDSP